LLPESVDEGKFVGIELSDLGFHEETTAGGLKKTPVFEDTYICTPVRYRGMAIRTRIVGAGRAPLLVLVAVCVAVVNCVGLLVGITTALPHLFYLPIALAGYWYPRQGPAISAGIAVLYAAPSLALVPDESLTIAARAVTLVAVGTLIAYLTTRLRAQEEAYHGLFDHSVASIFVVDRDGRVQDANPRAAALADREPDRLIGIPFAELAKEPEEARAFLSALADGTVENQELTLVRGDRRSVYGLASGAPLGTGSAIITVLDQTGQHLARAALEATNRTMATIAGILDHDLTSSVRVLEDCIDRGRASARDPEVVALLRQFEERVAAISRRIAVSRDFRELGARPPLWQSVRSAVDEARARLDPGPVEVRAWVDRLEVYADPAFPVALYHLLDNATSADTAATTVVVSYHHSPDGCRISIEDDGIGIPPDERPRLFLPTSSGYGRGLYLASEILGITNIGISEEGDGTGARFVLDVPLEECRVR
jgi:PAS domain S-box-containing protein